MKKTKEILIDEICENAKKLSENDWVKQIRELENIVKDHKQTLDERPYKEIKAFHTKWVKS